MIEVVRVKSCKETKIPKRLEKEKVGRDKVEGANIEVVCRGRRYEKYLVTDSSEMENQLALEEEFDKRRNENEWILFGSQLSPFALKLAAGMTDLGVKFEWSWQKGIFTQLRLNAMFALVRNKILDVQIPEHVDKFVEFPLVPYVVNDAGLRGVDSTSILAYFGVDSSESAAVQFISLLLEEFFDEWGLYLVHHMRWTDPKNVAIWTKDEELSPGAYLGKQEMYGSYHLLGPARGWFAKWFNHRQQERLPYFLSVDAKSSKKTGFQESQKFLNRSFLRLLQAMEDIFADMQQNESIISAVYSLGKKLAPIKPHCAADFACFGCMNMLAHLDRGSRATMETTAPNFVSWLDTIQIGIQNYTGQPTFPLAATPVNPKVRQLTQSADAHRGLKALLKEITSIFIPLMKANEYAFEEYESAGLAQFNEAAFNKREGMYEVNLTDPDGCAQKFSISAKTFQAGVWKRIKSAWFEKLSEEDRKEVVSLTGVDISTSMSKALSPDLIRLFSASKL